MTGSTGVCHCIESRVKEMCLHTHIHICVCIGVAGACIYSCMCTYMYIYVHVYRGQRTTLGIITRTPFTLILRQRLLLALDLSSGLGQLVSGS